MNKCIIIVEAEYFEINLIEIEPEPKTGFVVHSKDGDKVGFDRGSSFIPITGDYAVKKAGGNWELIDKDDFEDVVYFKKKLGG